MKTNWILIGVLLSLVGCEIKIFGVGDDEDCNESYSLVGDVDSNYQKELYSEAKSGYSCKELENRIREYYYPSVSSCGAVPTSASTDTSQVDEVANSDSVSDTTFKNNVIGGVEEPREFIVIEDWTLRQDSYADKLIFLDSEENYGEYIHGLRYAKIMARENKLVISGYNQNYNGSRILIGEFSEGEFILEKEIDLSGYTILRLIEDTLYYYETHELENLPFEINCEDIYYVDNSYNQNINTLKTINLNQLNSEPKIIHSYYGYLKSHFEKDEIYYYQSDYDYNSQVIRASDFGIVKVDGKIPNKFAIKEKKNFVLVGTERGHDNTIQSLNFNAGKVQQVIDGLGETETIYSMRFTSDRAYMVTFRQTDPLYAFDISAPGNIKYLSELKIPGFSRYLHHFSERRIIGLGKTEGWWSDVQISLFKEYDDGSVEKVDSIIFEDLNSLEAFWNHHQFIQHRDYFLIRNDNEVLVFKLEGEKVIYLDSVSHLSFASIAFFKDNRLIVVDGRYREFDLVKGLPEIE